MQCFLVSGTDESCAADLKAVDCALVASDICDEWSVLVCLLLVPRLYVFVEGHCELKNVECFLLCVLNDNVWLELGDTECRSSYFTF